jgi:hypothetical protein
MVERQPMLLVTRVQLTQAVAVVVVAIAPLQLMVAMAAPVS